MLRLWEKNTSQEMIAANMPFAAARMLLALLIAATASGAVDQKALDRCVVAVRNSIIRQPEGGGPNGYDYIDCDMQICETALGGQNPCKDCERRGLTDSLSFAFFHSVLTHQVGSLVSGSIIPHNHEPCTSP